MAATPVNVLMLEDPVNRLFDIDDIIAKAPQD
jgi:hypothetical protein